jgi:phosphoserine phosphatase RsbU/P
LVEVEPGIPLGVHLVAPPRSSATIALSPDSVVAFYTDGLVERRGESLDEGFERLRDAMSLEVPERVASGIMRHVIGNHVPRDDIALVVVRRTELSRTA